MTDFMQLTTYKKGALYVATCNRCGLDIYSHEWYHVNNNDLRDALQNGTARCDECGLGKADPATFQQLRDSYACHYSAPGYMDCTPVMYGTNRRELEREVKNLYNL
jgi:ribosomal protein L37E